jgi:hypothetical protein
MGSLGCGGLSPRRFVFTSLFVAVVLIVGSSAFAQDTFTGSGLWSSGGDWSGGVPGSGTAVAIRGDVTQDNAGGVTIASLQFGVEPFSDTPELTLDGSLSVTGNVNVYDPSTIDLGGQILSAAAINLNDNFSGAGIDIDFETVGGAASSGTIDTSAITNTAGNNVLFNGTYTLNGNFVNGSTSQVTSNANVATENGSFTINGSLTNAGGTQPFGGASNFTAGGDLSVSEQVVNSGASGGVSGPSSYTRSTLTLNGSTTTFDSSVSNTQGGYINASGTSLTVQGNITNDGLVQATFPLGNPSVLRTEFDIQDSASLSDVTNQNGGLLQIGTALASFNPIVLPSAEQSGFGQTVIAPGAIPASSTPPDTQGTTIDGTLTNQSGGLFTYNGSGGLTITGKTDNTGVLNESYSFYSNAGASPLELISTMIVNGPLTTQDDVTNENGAQMFFYGQSTIGQIDREGGAPDLVASLTNQSGGLFDFQPNDDSDNMEVTGQITNTGSGTVMDLLGDVVVVGRNQSSPLLTNTNGATLNYNSTVDVGIDRGLYVPAGNLDNDQGTINGLGTGNMTFYGGDQTNDGTINLANSATVTIGPAGENTLTNNGVLAAVSASGGTTATLAGQLVNSTGAVVNSGSIFSLANVTGAATTTLTVSGTATASNAGGFFIGPDGAISLSGGLDSSGSISNNGDLTTPTTESIINTGSITTTDLGATITTGTFENNAGGSITIGNALGANSLGFTATTFLNGATGTINIGTVGGMAATLSLGAGVFALNEPTGTINVGAGGTATGTLSATADAINNAGTINLNGGTLNAMSVVNLGTIGVVGGANVIANPAGSVAPTNTGTINISAASATLTVDGGGNGANFINNGAITMLGTLTTTNTPYTLTNNGSISGSGTITFPTVTNNGSITVNGDGESLTVTGMSANAGTINIQGSNNAESSNTLFLNTAAFTNNGSLNFTGNFTYASDFSTRPALFTNAVGANIKATGSSAVMDFINGINNNGAIQVSGALAVGSLFNLGLDTITNGAITNGATGTIAVSGGATLQYGSAAAGVGLTNNGAIVVNGANSNFKGSGVLTNNGSFLVDPSSASLGGVVNTGSFTVGNGSTVTNNGAFTNNNGATASVTGAGTTFISSQNFTNNQGAAVNISNGATVYLNGSTPANPNGNNGSVLTNNGAIMLTGNGTKLHSGGNWNNNSPGIIIVGAGTTVDPNNVDNTGTMTIDGSFTANTYTQTGASALTTVDGTLTVNSGPVSIQDGILNGGGTVAGGLDNPGGNVIPGGVSIDSLYLNVTGDYTQEGGGELTIGINSATNYDTLAATGTAGLDGTLLVNLLSGFTPAYADRYTILTADGGDSGDFGNTLPVTDDIGTLVTPTYQFSVIYGPNSVVLTNFMSVPEPGSVVLLSLGMWMAGMRRPGRRRVGA